MIEFGDFFLIESTVSSVCFRRSSGLKTPIAGIKHEVMIKIDFICTNTKHHIRS